MSDSISSGGSSETTLIVGAGEAGGEAAMILRNFGYEGRIVLIGDEPHLPYKRPPLSKTFLAGEAALETLVVRPAAAFEKARIETMIGRQVRSIDRTSHRVTLDDGTTLPYTKLVLATGGRARLLAVPGASSSNVFHLRNIADVEAIRAEFAPGKRLVIIGGGYVGLEVAAVAVKLGLQVTVLESLPRVLSRVTAPEMSAFYERTHSTAGVDLRTSVKLDRFETSGGRATAAMLADGISIPLDLVVVGIGLIPNTELAAEAGLEVGDGIIVDEYARTSDPDIVACGDCTNHPNALLGRRLRLESVPNANEQARVAAGTLAGKPVPYASIPWFWSDQYDLKLQMAGLSQGYDRIIIRGSPESNSFVMFYLDPDNRVIAADAVNRLGEFLAAKRLVAERFATDTDRLGDESVPLKSLLAPKPKPAA